MAVLRPEHAPTQLTTIERRAELLAEAGADHVLALPFDRDMASWTPEEFEQRVLVDALHAGAVVVGANFRFGTRASGDVATLQDVRCRARLHRRGDPARRRPDGLVVDLRPHLPGRAGRGRRGRGARPPVRRARRRRPGRPPRPRARLPDRQRADRRDDRGARRRGLRRLAEAARHRRDLPGRDQRRHQPDLRRRPRPPGRELRARPHRPRAVRRRGRGLLRRPAARHGRLRVRREARRADARRRRHGPASSWPRP